MKIVHSIGDRFHFENEMLPLHGGSGLSMDVLMIANFQTRNAMWGLKEQKRS